MVLKNYIPVIILILLASLNLPQCRHSRPEITMNIGCGYTGQTDKEFYEYAAYIKSGDYEAIREKLNSHSLFNRLLSSISLEELSLQGKVILTEKEKETISHIKRSKEKYYLCQGCTGHYYSTIHKIFKHDPDDRSLLNHLKLIKHKLGFKVDY